MDKEERCLAENYHLHRFYESLRYIRIWEMTDKTSGLTGFVYEKSLLYIVEK